MDVGATLARINYVYIYIYIYIYIYLLRELFITIRVLYNQGLSNAAKFDKL
jgi:hypothetical protein